MWGYGNVYLTKQFPFFYTRVRLVLSDLLDLLDLVVPR